MINQTLDQLSELLDKKTKPIHGEVARINHELIDLNFSPHKTQARLSDLEKEVARLNSNLTTLGENMQSLTNAVLNKAS